MKVAPFGLFQPLNVVPMMLFPFTIGNCGLSKLSNNISDFAIAQRPSTVSKIPSLSSSKSATSSIPSLSVSGITTTVANEVEQFAGIAPISQIVYGYV